MVIRTQDKHGTYSTTSLVADNPDRVKVEDTYFIVYLDSVTLQVEGVVRKGNAEIAAAPTEGVDLGERE